MIASMTWMQPLSLSLSFSEITPGNKNSQSTPHDLAPSLIQEAGFSEVAIFGGAKS
jgi:hypothetical protein